ncbi:2-octaprenyl-6-methoxyphenyl hydroxylase [Pseudomarimonas arenosa]|uniref:2-octaprenyl-6-methoxyphenyl hydroxylase n=1 Tax=Pseudomarimonas arenosa TaxID=2774145 RepID=A0AAW3ZM38_9GAMM|nr:2-octaprenyl-6-methoxyphenyl hydroxylase [Pseudomarimonas arenosa]MBD8525955.1 2-octaprenyl-6-methoxyphenyl hydroxylase [Pseudomarimonas arenosa]
MSNEQMDVLIVGGGLVGCSLAIALAESRWKVGLVESQAGGQAAPPSFDERNLALARASLNALGAMGVLDRLPRSPAAIEQIHISRQGDLGVVRLAASDYGVDALGGVVMARDLGLALQARCEQLGTPRFAPATLQAAEPIESGWRVTLITPQGEQQVRTRLLVGADGTDSRVRQALDIGVQTQDYQQSLIVCSVQSSRKPDGRAWERFSSTGPVALLPRNDGRFGAVCGVASHQLAEQMKLDDQDYLEYLQQRFGWRAGRFLAVGKRVAYPLRATLAERLLGPRAVLVGNAAQTVHPLGAQGFNLGLRDALSLAECLAETDDPGSESMLERYVERRRQDRALTLDFSHGLAQLTAREGDAMHAGRSLALLLLERSVALKARMAAGAMGFRGQVPALARAAR